MKEDALVRGGKIELVKLKDLSDVAKSCMIINSMQTYMRNLIPCTPQIILVLGRTQRRSEITQVNFANIQFFWYLYA